MRQDEHQGGRAVDSFDYVRHGDDVRGELNPREIFCVHMGGVDDLGQLLPVDLLESISDHTIVNPDVMVGGD